jgi:predicted dithiol-disulfide oxidoreductase (DUF899 family)
MEPSSIASKEEWRRAHEALPAKEKEATRTPDALAAERRRQLRRNCDRSFLTYETRGRGVEATLKWPPGHPQTPPYEWWRSHDAYGVQR